MNQIVFRVVPHEGMWLVEYDERHLCSHQTKDVAVREARELARERRPSQVIVYGEDGEIEDQSTYPDDPLPPPV